MTYHKQKENVVHSCPQLRGARARQLKGNGISWRREDSRSYKVHEYLKCGCQMDGALSSGAQQQDKGQWAPTGTQKMFHVNMRKFSLTLRVTEHGNWAALGGCGVSFSGDIKKPIWKLSCEACSASPLLCPRGVSPVLNQGQCSLCCFLACIQHDLSSKACLSIGISKTPIASYNTCAAYMEVSAYG